MPIDHDLLLSYGLRYYAFLENYKKKTLKFRIQVTSILLSVFKDGSFVKVHKITLWQFYIEVLSILSYIPIYVFLYFFKFYYCNVFINKIQYL